MEAKLERQRSKALGEMLVAECKSDDVSFDRIETLIYSGAQISYKNSRPVFVAAKNQNFPLLQYLIKRGALLDPAALGHIAGMCDYKGFCEQNEQQYFELLDEVKKKAGSDYLTLLSPYVNLMAVNGKTDKIKSLALRYDIPVADLAGLIYLRIIFEMITSGFDDALKFVESHKHWIDAAAFNLCVSSNEWVVMEYIIEHSDLRAPSEKAVAEALFKGCIQTLIILEKTGYSFSGNSLYLEKACRGAFSNGVESLEFLLRHGYSLNDKYKGRTIWENAVADKNAPLIEFLKKRGYASF